MWHKGATYIYKFYIFIHYAKIRMEFSYRSFVKREDALRKCRMVCSIVFQMCDCTLQLELR